MTTAPQLVVHRDKELMAQAAAARLITKIVDAQAARGFASVVLTGGRNGNGLLAALSSAPARDAVDWSRLDLWWGDERFLPEGDPERNYTQAREALLDSVPLDPARVHPMPASDGPYGVGADTDGADAAAEAYAAELAAAAGPEHYQSAAAAAGGRVPTFDVLMLGVGPDTHVASLFPELPAVRETERTVVGVHGAPKPPPTRISLTLPAIRSAREVWLLAAGEDKAKAAAIALSGAGEVQAPAAGAYGRSRTLWLLDAAAASQLPRDLYPPASP
ncbi:6-phosphogluconolactonase [Streptomyces spectabilis]|uniref:6-phosphogluconolactonase n=1 Tax=Streptomyces spectabilis TaxID=68270 RepID=UPI0033E8E07E